MGRQSWKCAKWLRNLADRMRPIHETHPVSPTPPNIKRESGKTLGTHANLLATFVNILNKITECLITKNEFIFYVISYRLIYESFMVQRDCSSGIFSRFSISIRLLRMIEHIVASTEHHWFNILLFYEYFLLLRIL